MNRLENGSNYFLNPVKFEVLSNLMLETGVKAAPELIHDALDSRKVNATLWIGEGGIGKSHGIAQLFRASNVIRKLRDPLYLESQDKSDSKDDYLRKKAILNKYNKMVINVLFPFDWFVDKVKKEKGDIHQSEWHPDEWSRVSEVISDVLEPKLDEVSDQNLRADYYGQGPKWRITADPVVLGDLDKGREAVKKLAKRPDVKVLGLITDPHIKVRAARIRQAVMQPGLSPEMIEKCFIEEGIVLDIDDFARVPSLMARMANANLMNASDIQVERQIDQMEADGINLGDFPLPEQVLTKIEDNTPLSELDKTIKHYQRRFPHMLYVLRRQLQIPQPRSHALFNVYLRGTPIHWYQKDLEKSMSMVA